MRGLRMVVGALALCLLFGVAASPQASLQFNGHVTVGGGSSCQQTAQNAVQCTVVEGCSGTIVLTAIVSPSQSISVFSTSVPTGWNTLNVTGWGTLNTSYAFTVPSGTAGSTYALVFRAAAGGMQLDLHVTLQVVSTSSGTGSSWAWNPFTVLIGNTGSDEEMAGPAVEGTTDQDGAFTVTLPELSATVSGTLSICDGAPLADQPFTVTPMAEGGSVDTVDDLSGFSFTADGYDTTEIAQFGRITFLGVTMIDVGSVCLAPVITPLETLTLTCPEPEPGYVLVGYTYVVDYVCVDYWGEDDPGEDGYVYLHSVTRTENNAVTSDETLYCVYRPMQYTCPEPQPGYRLVGYTYVRNYAVVESWGAYEASADGYIHIESRTKVENGVTVSDEIWSCVYEPE